MAVVGEVLPIPISTWEWAVAVVQSASSVVEPGTGLFCEGGREGGWGGGGDGAQRRRRCGADGVGAGSEGGAKGGREGAEGGAGEGGGAGRGFKGDGAVVASCGEEIGRLDRLRVGDLSGSALCGPR